MTALWFILPGACLFAIFAAGAFRLSADVRTHRELRAVDHTFDGKGDGNDPFIAPSTRDLLSSHASEIGHD